jgi:phage/plasmid-associated DNA primase
MNKCKISIWWLQEDQYAKPLGKSFDLDDGKLIKEDLCTNAQRFCVKTIESLDDLELLIDSIMHDGYGFMTSGVPKDTTITEAKVTVKDFPKKGFISRSKDDIEWRSGTGTYFVIDYDPDWSNGQQKTVGEIHQAPIQALKIAGFDASELQMLVYPSSSSGFVRKSDEYSFDKGGRHLIILVEDAGDLERFKPLLFDYMTLAGLNYGAVSDAGHFLKRGIIDLAAISPTQPTFSGIPAYNKIGLINVREDLSYIRLSGDMLALDTKMVRDLTNEEITRCHSFWEAERVRLQPQIDRKKRKWLAKQGKKLAKRMPDASPEQIRSILEHRWSGNLVGSDWITLGGRKVSISQVLANPDKYDGMTGPDPIEPDYRNGAQTCKVFINRSNGRPMIYSQAHGGINYPLWHDAQSAMIYLSSKDMSDARASVKIVLRATRVADSTEIESLLLDLAKLVKIPKRELSKNYRKLLIKNMRAVTSNIEHVDHVKTNEAAQINDISHNAAKRFISTQISVQCDESQVWIFNGKCWETASDRYLAQSLMKILTEPGWENEYRLTSITRDAITSVKEQTHTKTPFVGREPKPILNFKNGELHFLPTGEVELREHDPSSGLTYVLPIDYDPNAKAPIFQRTLEEMFWPPAKERMQPRSKAGSETYEKQYLADAVIMRQHVEEVLAYLIIPSRWIAALFVWIGGGHNGKTFLTRVINLLLDDSTIESDRLKAFSKSEFGMERLIGKTLIIDDDLDANTTIPDGFVKKISESKLISASRKYKASHTFFNRSALLLLTNNYPRLIDVSVGMIRRIYSLDFPRRFYSQEEINTMDDGVLKEYAMNDLANPGLIDKIEGELAGVANILVRAYQRLMKRGHFKLPQAVKESNNKLLDKGNPLPLFIKTCCETGSALRFRTSEFASALKRWITNENIRWNPTNPQVRTMMRHLGWDDVTIDGHEHYVGISLKPGVLASEMPINLDDDSDEDGLDDWDDDDAWDDDDDVCDDGKSWPDDVWDDENHVWED